MVNVKSKRGAVRRVNALLHQYRERYASGGMFGFDWITMKINSPEIYREIKDLESAFPALPE